MQIFSQATRLLVVLRQVVELEMMSPPDIAAALAEWHQKVPLPFKLHDAGGCRNAYIRPVNELFIMYFAIIILVFYRRGLSEGGRTRVSPTMIVASSCMIRLYEEIYHHEQAARLGSVHGFYLMLAAIPQIFHRTQSAEKEHLREKELDLICAVLRQLRVKYGGSNMVLRKVTGLRAESQTCEQCFITETPQDVSEITAGGLVPECDRLFPFPLQFCSNLNLLNASIPEDDFGDNSMIDFLAFENSLIDWPVDGIIDFDGPTATDFPRLE
jgi:hypothetical protein